MTLAFLVKQRPVAGLAGDAVSVLGQHFGDTASGDEVPHPIECGTDELRPAPPLVAFLGEDFESLASGILP